MLDYILPRRTFRNREGLREFDFSLHRKSDLPGVSGLMRVKNEEAKIEHALRSILPVFDEIVVADNGSTDRTVELVEALRQKHENGAKIRLVSYPHQLARFGPEHQGTPEDSIRSAVYFTNWAIAHCAYKFVCKWDGDMVLRRQVRDEFRRLLDEIQAGRKTCWVLAGLTVYRESGGGFCFTPDEVNREVEVFPYGLPYRFVKGPRTEQLRRPFIQKKEFEPVCFFELKYVEEDEFDHWSSTDWQTMRKRREWRNFNAVREGTVDGNFRRLPPHFLDDQVAASLPSSPPDYLNELQDRVLQRAVRHAPPTRRIKPKPGWKLWLRRTKQRLGYYDLRARLHEDEFRPHLRPTDTFLIGHPKSGNTWLAYLLALLKCGEHGHTVDLLNVGDYVPFVHGADYEIGEYGHLPDPRVFRNEYPQHRRLYPKIIYILRDPRSVLVSFWHMYRVIYDDDTVPLDDFVDQYMRGTGIFTYWNRPLIRWDRQVRRALRDARRTGRTHIVRYEDLVERRRETLQGVARFLDLPVDDQVLDEVVRLGDFDAMRNLEDRSGAEAYTGRALGSGRFIRKGRIDGWRDEMDEATAERIGRVFRRAMKEAGYL
jgi:glycosyltransferase involved in cell wall biosynthesis